MRSRPGAGPRSRGFRSLIVVTSNYHMPRALAEIAHQLPDVALVPFPVVTDKLARRAVVGEQRDRPADVVRICEIRCSPRFACGSSSHAGGGLATSRHATRMALRRGCADRRRSHPLDLAISRSPLVLVIVRSVALQCPVLSEPARRSSSRRCRRWCCRAGPSSRSRRSGRAPTSGCCASSAASRSSSAACEKIPPGRCSSPPSTSRCGRRSRCCRCCRDPAYILKRELMWIPFFGWYAWKAGMIPVDRGKRVAGAGRHDRARARRSSRAVARS